MLEVASRPRRHTKPPTYLSYYFYLSMSFSCSNAHPLCTYMCTSMSYHLFSTYNYHFIMAIDSVSNPQTYEEVVERKIWSNAMADKL